MTDYTENRRRSGLRPLSAHWCPPNLARRTLRVEFFGDGPANFVLSEEMGKGQFWSFNNVWLKRVHGDQYLEATYSEVQKACRLEEKDVDGNQYFEALLRYVSRRRLRSPHAQLVSVAEGSSTLSTTARTLRNPGRWQGMRSGNR